MDTAAPRRLLLALAALALPFFSIAPRGVAQAGVAETSVAWFEEPGGSYRTYEFRERRTVSLRRGLFVAVGNELVELRVEQISADAWTCDHQTGQESRAPGQLVHGARLIAARGTASQVLLDSTEIDGNEYAADEIIIHGSLGPFVSVERREDHFPVCSAHPVATRMFFWFDLRDGSQLEADQDGRVQVPSGIESQLADAEQRLRSEFRQAIIDSGQDAGEWAPDAGPFWVEGIVPRLHRDHWAARIHVALGVPYGSSRGPAADQIVEEFDVPGFAAWLPAGLTRIGPEVTRFARRHPRARLGGVSALR